ncbi:hypothetical protein LCGC14_1252130 [marine sediment metagenome]|uniref:histidine kinase n=1 Tax=marine sediment metagenome TaxID=412755 RepID=A0A0F9P6N7_9ZZZZ
MASLSGENYNPEKYLLDTLNDLDIGFVKVSNDGVILNHNLTFNKIFGYNPEESLICTKTLDYWLNSEESNKFREILFKNGVVKKYITPAKKFDGKKIFLEVNFKLNKNSNGEVISSEGFFVDITEKIELEQKLKESETKFRVAVENSPDFIVFIKKDGTITEANHLVKGFTKETVIGQSVFNEYFYETKDQLESVRKAISDSLESGEIIQYYHSQIAPDGSHAFYESKVSPFEYDDESRIISLQLTIREITERRKAEQKLKESEKELENLNKELELKIEERTNKLKESEERWRIITKYTPDHIWVIDTNYKLTFVNYTVPDLSVDEVIGNHYSNFVQKEYLEQHEEILKEVMETGKTILWETGYLDNYGKQLYFDVHSGPIFKEGKVIGIVTRSTDITERRKKEEELRLHSEMMENMNEGVNLIRFSDLCIVYANPRFEEMFGYDPGEIIGKHASIINAPNEKSPEEAVDDIVAIMEESGEWHGDIQNIKKDGTLLWCFANVSSFDHPEFGKVCVSILTDITERKKVEVALKESEHRLKEAQALGKIGYWEFDITSQQITWSDQVFELYNRDPSLGPPSAEEEAIYYTPDTSERLKEYSRRALEFGEEFDYDLQANLPSGKVVQLTALMRSIKNKSGQTIKLVGTVQDITERKIAEQKLKESEEILKKFMESATDGFILFDSKLNYLSVNNVTLQLLGMPREDLIGKNILEIDPSLKETGRYDKYLDVILTGVPYSTEDIIYNRLDGSLTYLSVRAFKVGKALGIIFTDITERKKGEEKILKERNKAQSYLDLAGALLIALNKNGNISMINKKGCEVLGYLEEELIGKQWFKTFLPPQFCEPVFKDFKRLIRGELEPIEFYENPILTKNGEERIIAWHNSLLHDKEENIIGTLTSGEDITERKKKEEEIKFHSVIMTNLVEGVHLIRADDGKIVYTNPAFEEMFGYNPGEMIGKDISIVNAPTDKVPEETKEEIMGILLETGRWHGDINNIKKDGTTFWCNANVSLLDHPEYGKVIVAVHSDITERKKGEEKILEEKNKAQSYLDLAGAMIMALDKNGNISMINKKGCEILGYLEEELIGKQWFKTVLPPRFSEPVFEDFKRIIRGELEPLEFYENPILTKNGEERMIAWHNSLLYDKEGSIIGGLSSGEDITEKKKKEKKIFDLAQFPSENPYPVLRVSRNNVLYINDTGQRLINTVEHNQIPDIFKENVKKTFEINQITESEVELDSRIYSFMITPVKDADYVNIYGMDITERKHVEEKLREVNKLKSEFLRRASHELKTPLISIKGFSDLILTLYEDQLDASILSKLREINGGCERLQSIINNLLKTSRLESPELLPSKQKEDLSFLIKYCVHELESLAERRKQSIKLKIQNGLYANVEKEEIYDVLSNLLTNAIKYTPPNGKIEINTELKEDSVVVSVKDNGIGFTEEQKTIIFQQFGKIERYGQGLDLGIDGTGLGLYISKRIVESHGGKIWMESEGKNKGSSFYFTLPIVN